MGNVNGKKYGLTSLFPILEGSHYADLRKYLRSMSSTNLFGSPLSSVPMIHMARFAILDDLAFQGLPAKRDTLASRYMLFMCDFDGSTVEHLVRAMLENIPSVLDDVWTHCRAYPGRGSHDALIAFFEQCQLETNLFVADRPDDEVATILRALMCKREFVGFVEAYQRGQFADPRVAFQNMWLSLRHRSAPEPGSM
jgi:hypothetical protein